MRDFFTIFLPIVAVLFLLTYVFLINPDTLAELGGWLRGSQFGR